jgi:ABC-type polysaccharide/polyol phosphate export systems, permease component
MPKKKIAIMLIVFALIINFMIIFFAKLSIYANSELNVELQTKDKFNLQVFYDNDLNFKEIQSVTKTYSKPETFMTLKSKIPLDSKNIRVDLGDIEQTYQIKNMTFKYHGIEKPIDLQSIIKIKNKNAIKSIKFSKNVLQITTNDVDPFFVININKIDKSFLNYESKQQRVAKTVLCVFIDALLLILFVFSNKLFVIPLDLYRNRKLVFYLARNDFKTKYAGSYFGIFWAFVQPVITILLYWFVFQVGLKSQTMSDVPFVLWLVAGLVPWFFYSEALSTATNCFIEYSFLVKKVVFNISVLPMVKIVSALFVHVFFIAFTFVVFVLNGFYPSIYSIQVLYYTICMFVLILSMSYLFSSIVLFFRDLSQIINIYLQIAMWMTPIMWNYKILPERFMWFFKMNPMYYVVEGYRDSFISKVWFFDKIEYTIYFWMVVGGLFILGTTIYKRLKPHFADVI